MIDNRHWPYSQLMVLQKLRLVFCPIAKNACTSLKRAMVRISTCPYKNSLLEGDIHNQLDLQKTGLQLKDFSTIEANSILRDPHYVRFAVLRTPSERLLSAYIEKFVLNRNIERNQVHTKKVITWCQKEAGTGEGDVNLSISFEQFVEYIVCHEPDDLDPHWKPQVFYLAGINYDLLFQVERLYLLENYLKIKSGLNIKLEHKNPTAQKASAFLPNAAKLSAAQVEELWPITLRSFLGLPGLQKKISAYFAEDIQLLENVVQSRANDSAIE